MIPVLVVVTEVLSYLFEDQTTAKRALLVRTLESAMFFREVAFEEEESLRSSVRATSSVHRVKVLSAIEF